MVILLLARTFSLGVGVVMTCGVGALVVDIVFIRRCFMWPLVVAGDLSRCFPTRSAVRPDQVEK